MGFNIISRNDVEDVIHSFSDGRILGVSGDTITVGFVLSKVRWRSSIRDVREIILNRKLFGVRFVIRRLTKNYRCVGSSVSL